MKTAKKSRGTSKEDLELRKLSKLPTDEELRKLGAAVKVLPSTPEYREWQRLAGIHSKKKDPGENLKLQTITLSNGKRVKALVSSWGKTPEWKAYWDVVNGKKTYAEAFPDKLTKEKRPQPDPLQHLDLVETLSLAEQKLLIKAYQAVDGVLAMLWQLGQHSAAKEYLKTVNELLILLKDVKGKRRELELQSIEKHAKLTQANIVIEKLKG